MEKSIAEELYSEILNMPNTELDPQSTTDNVTHNSHDIDGDDLWNDDEDLERQWHRRHKHFHTIGYRDGLMAGKEAIAQEGFNMGFEESVSVGQTWGLVRGVTSALACLPDGLKGKLVETDDKRNRLQHLHESVGDISTTDALKSFYERLNNRISEPGENIETSFYTGDLLSHFSNEDVLENHVQEFNTLVLECSALTVHLRNGL